MANQNNIEIRSSHVVLRMKFSMPNPPAYMKGQDRLDYLEERAWVSSDFIDYAGRKGKYSDKAKSHDEQFSVLPEKGNYLDYVARRGIFADKGEKGNGVDGTGVWNENGELSGEELEKVKKIFQTTGGNIWHGIISPTKEIGDVQLNTKEKAMEFSKACFTRFLASTHLDKNNITWYCGWHDDSESGIKHIQFAFCETAPHLTGKGEKTYTKKGVIQPTVLADALINFEEYFSGHREDVHIARDDIVKTFKKISPSEVKKELALELLNLAKVLPKIQGRIGYRSEAIAPFRERIDNIVTKMIRDIPTLNRQYIELMSKVQEREERFKNTAQQFRNMRPNTSQTKLRRDIKERLGNSIIAFAKRVDYTERQVAFNTVKEKNISLMQSVREEKLMRQKQTSERRKKTRRFIRLLNMFYKETTSRDFLEEYYNDLEHLKDVADENKENYRLH